MRIPSLPLLSGITLATALTLTAAPARAWITQTTDNSPTPTPLVPPQWWHWGWRSKPKPPPAPCRSKYCPPYYSETHGYTPPQWRPWPGAEQKMTTAPKADVNPPSEGTTPTRTTAAPTSLPDAVGSAMPGK